MIIKMNKYKSDLLESKEDLYKILDKGTNEDIKLALIGAVRGIDDFNWLQSIYLKYINHSNFWVAKTAINCLGDLARIHKKINLTELYYSFDKIEDEKLKPTIQDTLEDIMIFVKKDDDNDAD
ncbi:hypothetical protein [Polaribacter cellanae]|uniref:Uncharacterized protein n=1 Tax=Polaribacter cellanae TaxID=2818493 RepID=A0A975H5A2_9FLAO|nr:hypothetical protein [Polaribacter cellanae]QTE21205.1 hypothetical protein J3359_10160 [Polaribacter cellanae]QTE21211.1 hypothetical protein J3359_10195 [Polaribacter cellanae]QTE21219.1 hypothetical protein J3359_10240 [Polaribacter cellanae]